MSVLLKKSPFPDISPQELAQQLQGKQIARKKFPALFQTQGIIYPKKVHLEQASSEQAGRYKAQLISGRTLLDLTGGMGMDSYHFASRFKEVICCEKNEDLARITAHNLGQLRRENVTVVAGDGLEYLRSGTELWDCIYIDPSRRVNHNRVFTLEDSEPDILEIQKELLSRAHMLMLKTSPWLDIERGSRQLMGVHSCHIVSIDNEVKELLWVCRPSPKDKPLRIAVNIRDTGIDTFRFFAGEERELKPAYSKPKQFLFEPNAAILKSGGFKSVAAQFTLDKLAPNTHLYTSDIAMDFPGRTFHILESARFSKNWNSPWGVEKANVTTRNFPLSVAELRKRFAISDGGNEYLFFTTLFDRSRVVLRCVKA